MQDLVEKAVAKRDLGKRMSLKEWQLVVYSHSPSSLWNDFLPKFLSSNGVPVKGRYTPAIWKAFWDLAVLAHEKMMRTLVAETPPTISFRGKTYLL